MSDRTANSEALQSQYAMRIAARLTEHAGNLPPDIGERLRFARSRALEHARAVRATRAAVQPQVVVTSAGAGAATLAGAPRGETSPWWSVLVSLLPLLALVAGLVLIQSENTRRQVAAAVEVDTALLLDELPPSAYSDPGFVEYLKHKGD